MNKRPISVTIVASLYLIVGSVGFAVHGKEILARHAFQYGDALIELTELIAIVCGVFMLQGRNWARWLALAWILFHVAFSLFNSLQRGAIHGLFLVLIAYFLFRPDARTYFQRTEEMGS
ncbi:MAG: hypothetical protein WAK48_14670 [Candidatus Acidiferrum sp.]|jgi:hypothetical protein